MSLGVSDQVRHKPGCTARENGYRLEISDLGRRCIYYPCSKNKGADQLRGHREADLRLKFRICDNRFSHDAAQILLMKQIAILIHYVQCLDTLPFHVR